MKSTLRIYCFTNKLINNIKRPHYFIAPDRYFAIELAKKFQFLHNDRVRYSHMDTIDFDIDYIKEYPIATGYLSI